jgi:hypothetical protein
MKKSGGFSLFVYVLYLLLGGGGAIYHYLASQSHNEGLENLGHAIIFLFGLVAAAVGLLGLILKLIHMASGAGFFGFLCALLDVAVVVLLVVLLMDQPGESLDPMAFAYLSPIFLASGASAVCNLASMGR